MVWYPLPMMEGWLCSKCQVAVSPYVQVCPMCVAQLEEPEPEGPPDPDLKEVDDSKILTFHKPSI